MFTSEQKGSLGFEQPTLAFLDVLVKRQHSIGFETTIYRKQTESGLMTKRNSFVPERYKYDAISSMVYRAMKVCSTYKALAIEFIEICERAVENDYPISVLESVVRRQLNL